jgi:hypothetical protein
LEASAGGAPKDTMAIRYGLRRREVAAAKAVGLNTLRLHIKAFDPAYLEVCDELGMLLRCDVPVAEPIAHEELAADRRSGGRGPPCGQPRARCSWVG